VGAAFLGAAIGLADPIDLLNPPPPEKG